MWRDVVGYEGIYKVNRDGEIYKIRKDGSLRQVAISKRKHTKRHFDYYVVKLLNTIHNPSRVVAKAWLGLKDNQIVIHRNKVLNDFSVINLVCVTREEAKKKKILGHTCHNAIVKIDQEGNDVWVYKNAEECAKENFISKSTIYSHCLGYKHIGKPYKTLLCVDGFYYAYEDDDDGKERIYAEIRRRKAECDSRVH